MLEQLIELDGNDKTYHLFVEVEARGAMIHLEDTTPFHADAED